MTSISPTVFVPLSSSFVCSGRKANHPNPGVRLTKHRRSRILTTFVTSDVSAAADPTQAVATWQIVVGSLAGVAPFVVAASEFSKRIIAQRNCGACKGSGLVLKNNKNYFRCPKCGGFLPWQSWKRFFSG